MEPHACPEAEDEAVVGQPAREPLAPKLLVALAAGALFREVEVPLTSEDGTGVVEAEEVDEGQASPREHQPEWVYREGILLLAPSPLQQPILELLRIPTELTLLQQVHGASVVAVVFQHKFPPRQREEVAPAVGDVFLPPVGRECCA